MNLTLVFFGGRFREVEGVMTMTLVGNLDDIPCFGGVCAASVGRVPSRRSCSVTVDEGVYTGLLSVFH
jgi:hypothetical protein